MAEIKKDEQVKISPKDEHNETKTSQVDLTSEEA